MKLYRGEGRMWVRNENGEKVSPTVFVVARSKEEAIEKVVEGFRRQFIESSEMGGIDAFSKMDSFDIPLDDLDDYDKVLLAACQGQIEVYECEKSVSLVYYL